MGKNSEEADVVQNKTDQLQFILTEGRNRQIRRMCELVGLTVVSLTRTRIGNSPSWPIAPRQVASDETR